VGAKLAVAEKTGADKIEAAVKPRVRDRIFETACDLFYRHGIRAVGVDAIAQEAGTNKMSFYRSFPSKEDLVAEYLREQEREYFEWWDGTIAPYKGDPRKQLDALFESYLGMTCSAGEAEAECRTSRGCALGNAAVEIPEDNEMLAGIVHAYKSEIRKRLRKLSRDAGARDPNALGDALMLLMEGGYYTRLTYAQNSGPVAAIAKAARALIEAHCN
jgi:AcrR family transcriptional regulator